MKVEDDTPIFMLTVGQFKATMNSNSEKSQEEFSKIDLVGKKFVFGLRGIRELFDVSHATAQRYKDTILKEAVSQQGRKIVVDVEKAMELFAEKEGLNEK